MNHSLLELHGFPLIVDFPAENLTFIVVSFDVADFSIALCELIYWCLNLDSKPLQACKVIGIRPQTWS